MTRIITFFLVSNPMIIFMSVCLSGPPLSSDGDRIPLRAHLWRVPVYDVGGQSTVSYTPLTLPTKRIAEM